MFDLSWRQSGTISDILVCVQSPSPEPGPAVVSSSLLHASLHLSIYTPSNPKSQTLRSRQSAYWGQFPLTQTSCKYII